MDKCNFSEKMKKYFRPFDRTDYSKTVCYLSKVPRGDIVQMVECDGSLEKRKTCPFWCAMWGK